MTPDTIITTKEVAARLRVAVSTLKRWRRNQMGPRWCRVGGRMVRYLVTDLEEWVARQQVQGELNSASSPVAPFNRTEVVLGIIQKNPPALPTGASRCDYQPETRS